MPGKSMCRKFVPPKIYAAIEVTAIYPPVELCDIERVFRDKNWGLPKDYAEFLCEWNGAAFSGNAFAYFPVAPMGVWGEMPFKWPAAESDIREGMVKSAPLGFLCGIDFAENASEISSLTSSQDSYCFSEFIPSQFIKIGMGMFDDSIAMAINGPLFGKIAYFSGAETSWSRDGRPFPSVKYLDFVSNSFEEFWGSLVVVEAA